jgi:hypothetical protein
MAVQVLLHKQQWKEDSQLAGTRPTGSSSGAGGGLESMAATSKRDEAQRHKLALSLAQCDPMPCPACPMMDSCAEQPVHATCMRRPQSADHTADCHDGAKA